MGAQAWFVLTQKTNLSLPYIQARGAGSVGTILVFSWLSGAAPERIADRSSASRPLNRQQCCGNSFKGVRL